MERCSVHGPTGVNKALVVSLRAGAIIQQQQQQISLNIFSTFSGKHINSDKTSLKLLYTYAPTYPSLDLELESESQNDLKSDSGAGSRAGIITPLPGGKF